MKHIVIFDTGRGGQLFSDYLHLVLQDSTAPHLRDTRITTVIDVEHSPYGTRSHSEIYALAQAALVPYIGCSDIIVIACNTVTVNAIDRFRSDYPRQAFVGFEPMFQAAAQLIHSATADATTSPPSPPAVSPLSGTSDTSSSTNDRTVSPLRSSLSNTTHNGTIVILATNATKSSDRYRDLKSIHASQFIILEPDCSSWVPLIDADAITSVDIHAVLDPIIDQRPDVVILGCTHFVAIRDQIAALFPSSQILHPSQIIADQILRLLSSQ